jgi:hypothetical protein
MTAKSGMPSTQISVNEAIGGYRVDNFQLE